jgi:hypothetical protein
MNDYGANKNYSFEMLQVRGFCNSSAAFKSFLAELSPLLEQKNLGKLFLIHHLTWRHDIQQNETLKSDIQ